MQFMINSTFPISKSMKENVIIGRNPVLEALKAGRTIDKLYIRQGAPEPTLTKIAGMARRAGIPVTEADKKRLDQLSDGGNHQGVVAQAGIYGYVSVEEILKKAEDAGEAPFIVLCDRICDPHNLGAIIRSANAAGAHGVVITKHDGVGVNATVDKVSAGAVSFTPVARVSSLPNTMEELQKKGVWITGADGTADRSLFEADLSGPVAIVVGNEGEGMSRLVREKCDFLVKIPMRGQTESLNASVAAALFMFEVARKR